MAISPTKGACDQTATLLSLVYTVATPEKQKLNIQYSHCECSLPAFLRLIWATQAGFHIQSHHCQAPLLWQRQLFAKFPSTSALNQWKTVRALPRGLKQSLLFL